MVIPAGWAPPPAYAHTIKLEPAAGGFFIVGSYREFVPAEAPGEPQPEPEGKP